MEQSKYARIGRYLSGEMTGIEREVFEQEVSADDNLKSLLQDATRIWDHIGMGCTGGLEPFFRSNSTVTATTIDHQENTDMVCGCRCDPYDRHIYIVFQQWSSCHLYI